MIEVREATPRERESLCNACDGMEGAIREAEVVLEIGVQRSSTIHRLCIEHFLELHGVVEGVYGWDVFRRHW